VCGYSNKRTKSYLKRTRMINLHLKESKSPSIQIKFSMLLKAWDLEKEKNYFPAAERVFQGLGILIICNIRF